MRRTLILHDLRKMSGSNRLSDLYMVCGISPALEIHGPQSVMRTAIAASLQMLCPL